MTIPKALIVILICCFGFYGLLRVSLWGQKKVRGKPEIVAVEPPNSLRIDLANDRIIESLKTKEMAIALKKIEAIHTKSSAHQEDKELVAIDQLSAQLSSEADMLEFRSWVDKNFDVMDKESEKIFDSLAYFLLDSRRDPLKYEKIHYILERMPPLKEAHPAERDLYLKISRDQSAEAKMLVPFAFMKLATHGGLDDEQKYIECVRFISQRMDSAEIVSMIDFYGERNPQYREKMFEEFREIVRPQ